MLQRIYFRADASSDIGYGHFIRTLALADMLKEDFDCTYFTVNPTLYQKEEMRKVCKYVILDSSTHFADFLSLLSGDEIVVLDNYFFSTDYQKLIKNKGCRLVCVDDMHDKHYVADVVINHTITDTNKFSIEPYTQLCLGYNWALLRSAFLVSQKKSRTLDLNNINIVLGFGGIDYMNLTEKFVELLSTEHCVRHITAIVGDKHSMTSNICSSKVDYLQNLSSDEIANVFRVSDLAFLSASTVCLEALCCGIAVAAGYYVDNQIDFYTEASRRKEIYPLGNLRDFHIHDLLLADILSEFSRTQHHVFNSDIPKKYKLLFCNLFGKRNYQIDGLLFKDYRNMDGAQTQEIWQIRNDESIRCWMDNPNEIPWEDHLTFMSHLFFSYKKMYFAVYCESLLLGAVNIEFDDSMDRVERGIFISPKYLNQSFGGKIEKALERIIKGWGVQIVTAKVLQDNVRSLKFHFKNGYTSQKEDGKYICLVKNIN